MEGVLNILEEIQYFSDNFRKRYNTTVVKCCFYNYKTTHFKSVVVCENKDYQLYNDMTELLSIVYTSKEHALKL